MPSIQILAGNDRHIDCVRDARHRFHIFSRHRIFQPHRLGVLHFVGQFDGIARIVMPVQVHAEIAIGSKDFADGFHTLHDPPEIAMRESLRVQIVAGLLILRIGFFRNAVALKFESGPAPFFGLGFVYLVAPGSWIVDIAHHLHGAIEANLVAEPAAE